MARIVAGYIVVWLASCLIILSMARRQAPSRAELDALRKLMRSSGESGR